MTALLTELNQQPQELRAMLAQYRAAPEMLDLSGAAGSKQVLLTGMGASFHAAWIAAFHLNSLGVPAVAIEATNLIHYPPAMLGDCRMVVYVSQSGTSGEVPLMLDMLTREHFLVAITNNPDSELALRADVFLPLMAGEETLIASKTYINALAILWLLARKVSGRWTGEEWDILNGLCQRVEEIVACAPDTAERIARHIDVHQPLIFLGHGPHAVTARQAAMVVSEWAKVAALNAGIGAFRHGFIEHAQAGTGVVVFAAPGRTSDSACELAHELDGYGVNVLMVENGVMQPLQEKSEPVGGVDEFLSPILDIIPVQFFAEALQRALGLEPRFRYISKVVRRL